MITLTYPHLDAVLTDQLGTDTWASSQTRVGAAHPPHSSWYVGEAVSTSFRVQRAVHHGASVRLAVQGRHCEPSSKASVSRCGPTRVIQQSPGPTRHKTRGRRWAPKPSICNKQV